MIKIYSKIRQNKLPFAAPLTPPLAPNRDYVKAKKAPERIVFENRINGIHEESEEELTEHNLRASMTRDALAMEFNDDDLSDSDLEYVQFINIFCCNSILNFLSMPFFLKKRSKISVTRKDLIVKIFSTRNLY